MNRGDKNTFFRKNKKIQKIVNNLDAYTVDDINKIKISKWIREMLVKLKTGEVSEVVSPLELAARMPRKAPQDRVYQVFTYTAPTEFIGTLEIVTGQLVLIIDDVAKINQAEMPASKLEGKITYKQDVKSVAEYVELNNDANWKRLMPAHEPRVVEQITGKGIDVAGVKVTIK